MGTKRKTQLMKLNVFITIIALAISLTSLFYVTYSWFIFQRRAESLGPKISIDQGLEYNLKYFIHNLDGGYPKYGHEPVNVVSTSYATDFLDVSSSFHDIGEYSLIEEPGYRVTFALEITSLPSGAEHNVTFTMMDYLSPAHDLYKYDNGGIIEDIYLAEAINIYTDTMLVSSSDNDTTITSFVNTFISDTTPTDLFNATSTYMPSDPILLDTSPNVAASDDNTSLIFFFTIEFSNTSDTFYKFKTASGANIIFEKAVLGGNSNVYKGLEFAILEIMVRKEYVI